MGYMQKKHEAKHVTTFLLISGLLVIFLSLCGIIFDYFIFNLLSEFRLQLIIVLFGFLIYTIYKKRFYATFFFSFLILFNIYIIISQNQLLAVEYAGKNPFIFKTMVHRLDNNHNDFAQTSNLINTKKPDLAVLFLNDEKIENKIGKYSYSSLDKLSSGETIQVLSRFPFSEKTAIKDGEGKEIAYLYNFPKFRRPISVIVTSLNSRFDMNEKDDAKTIKTINDFVKTREEPVMIIGGFNYSPWSNVFSEFNNNEYKTQAGLSPDFPTFLPLPLRLSSNYIYTLPGISIFETEQLEETSSNYNPLLFTVAIERKKRH